MDMPGQAAQAMLDSVIAALPDGTLLVNERGIVIASNMAAQEALQLNATGLALHAILRNSSFADAVEQVSRTGQATQIDDMEIFSRLPRHFGVHIAPVGRDGSLLVILRDLTREQRVEQMRSDFVANASHEMRTPLSAILGSIETLQGAARTDEKARDTFLASMLAQAKRMKRLVDDLLLLSRVEINEHVLPQTPIDLAEITRQACRVFAELAAQHHVRLAVEAKDAVMVQGAGEELLQVAQNLVENAIKYGKSGGLVDVSCGVVGGKAILRVRDHGPGIAAEHVPRLTERFYRVNTKESRMLGGTGLGLAIVKHIVSRHRGQLDIHSTPGQGSQFSVTFPVVKSKS